MPRDAPATNPYKGQTGIARVVKAFFHSLDGFADAWHHESAFRQEIVLAAVMIPVACWVPATAVERALLIGSVLLVLIVELLNSSLETAIDRISYDDHDLSRRAKDFGSAAVLVTLVLAAVVWALVLGHRLLGYP